MIDISKRYGYLRTQSLFLDDFEKNLYIASHSIYFAYGEPKNIQPNTINNILKNINSISENLYKIKERLS